MPLIFKYPKVVNNDSRAPPVVRGAEHFTLLRLPTELVSLVLTYMDWQDFLHCTETCTCLRDLIRHSSLLTYRLELARQHLVPIDQGPSGPTSRTLRHRLRTLSNSWMTKTFKPLPTIDIPNAGFVYEFMGGVYANGRGEHAPPVSGPITFYRLPSEEGEEVISWTHISPLGEGMAYLDFCIDPYQDLFVLVCFASEGSLCRYDVHIKTLTTNEPHPEAFSPLLQCLEKIDTDIPDDGFPRIKIQILDDLIGVLAKDVNDRGCGRLYIWNWKLPAFETPIILDPLYSSIDDFCFLSHQAFLTVSQEGYISVYTVSSDPYADPAISPTLPTTPTRRATFALPELHGECFYWDISLNCNPVPGHIPRPRTNPPAAARPSEPSPSPSTSTSGNLDHEIPMNADSQIPPEKRLPNLPPFYIRPDDRTLLISLAVFDVQGQMNSSFLFAVHIRIFLDAAQRVFEIPSEPCISSCSNSDPSKCLCSGDGVGVGTGAYLPAPHHPWSSWGPRNTRVLDYDQPVDWLHAVYGNKIIDRSPAGPPEAGQYQLRVREFGPAPFGWPGFYSHTRLKFAKVTNIDGVEVDEQEDGEVDEYAQQRHDMNLESTPSVMSAGEVFKESITSCLPYYTRLLNGTVQAIDVMMDDCRVVLLNRNEDGALTGMDVGLF
ncbi:hypothetical protein JAAARDRAFT_78129 [Jaapia argillacea MUCL 33604]|uniref:F-box domain-containing protein n=1 Tax=Jaapia argillacea MUCL 33604 TaxID=933084 RepID=A0A067PWX3_9AGAM|nr:hypothetical protein JAAARDRAFT_78129 [Jaapia argillacea MUCL 33604]